MINYYTMSEVSNSDLKSLKKVLYGIGESKADLEKAYAFGSLVDAMLTEPHRCNHAYRTMIDENFFTVIYDFETWEHAVRLVDGCRKDPLIAQLVKNMIGQYIFKRTLQFEHDGDIYNIKARCKFDGLNKVLKTSVDYKTTACTTRKQFIESIYHFDYDQQGSWYMDIARIDYHWIAGISKKSGEIFKFAMQRGDDTHKGGCAKYQFLAYKWVTLIDGFKHENTIKESAGNNQ